MSVQRIHRLLYGKLPPGPLADFYASNARGFDSGEFDPSHWLAIFALAIDMALHQHQMVVIMVPRPMEERTLKELKVLASRVFRRYRGCKLQVKSLTTAIKRLRLASRYLPDEPAAWVSMGFPANDSNPAWMRSKLWKPI